MAERDHRQAVKAALATNERIGELFAHMGTADHPRGLILVAYRNAQRALRDVYRRDGANVRLQVAEVLAGLQRDIAAAQQELLIRAVAAGRVAGRAQAEARGLDTVPQVVRADAQQRAWMAPLDAQLSAAIALDYPEDLLLGDEEHAGLVHPGPVARDGSRWVAGAVLLGFLAELGLDLEALGGRIVESGYMKQACSAIDERTTECCLQANGQMVPLDQPFLTLGAPAWADTQDWTPFHWWCRTAIVLAYPGEEDDGVTSEMRESAANELEAREKRGRVEIHPSWSWSQRG